nr:signal peptidase I [Bifidobacterium longum]
MLVVLLGRTFVFNVYVIPSRSMEDTLQIGDRVFASRLTPRLFALHRGDIIVFKDPADWMEGGAASHQSDVDNRQQSLPNQTCHRSARRYCRLQGIRGAHHGQRQTH